MRKVELWPTRDCEAGYGPDIWQKTGIYITKMVSSDTPHHAAHPHNHFCTEYVADSCIGIQTVSPTPPE